MVGGPGGAKCRELGIQVLDRVASKIRQWAVELPPLEGLLAVLADKIHHPLLEGVVEEPGSDGQLGAKGWRGPEYNEKDQPEEQIHHTIS